MQAFVKYCFVSIGYILKYWYYWYLNTSQFIIRLIYKERFIRWPSLTIHRFNDFTVSEHADVLGWLTKVGLCHHVFSHRAGGGDLRLHTCTRYLLVLRCVCSTLTLSCLYRASSFTRQPTLKPTHTPALPVNGYLSKTDFCAYTSGPSLHSHHFVCLDQVRATTLLSVYVGYTFSVSTGLCVWRISFASHFFLTTQGQRERSLWTFFSLQKLIDTPKNTSSL